MNIKGRVITIKQENKSFNTWTSNANDREVVTKGTKLKYINLLLVKPGEKHAWNCIQEYPCSELLMRKHMQQKQYDTLKGKTITTSYCYYEMELCYEVKLCKLNNPNKFQKNTQVNNMESNQIHRFTRWT